MVYFAHIPGVIMPSLSFTDKAKFVLFRFSGFFSVILIRLCCFELSAVTNSENLTVSLSNKSDGVNLA